MGKVNVDMNLDVPSAGRVSKADAEARCCASSKKAEAFSRTSCNSTSSLKLRASLSALAFTSSNSFSSSSSLACDRSRNLRQNWRIGEHEENSRFQKNAL